MRQGARQLVLTAHLEVKNFSTSPSVTSHSRCLICTERTLCAGCARGRWHEEPAQKKSWPGGPVGSDLGKGHFPHQSLKRKKKTQSHENWHTDTENHACWAHYIAFHTPQRVLCLQTALSCSHPQYLLYKKSSNPLFYIKGTVHRSLVISKEWSQDWIPSAKSYGLSAAW